MVANYGGISRKKTRRASPAFSDTGDKKTLVGYCFARLLWVADMFSHKIYLDPWMLVNPTRLKGASDVVLRYVALEPGQWDLKSIAFDADMKEQEIKKATTLLIRRGFIRSLQTSKLSPTAMGVWYAWQLYGAYRGTDKPKAAGLPKLLVIWSLAHGARTVAQIVADTELNDGTVRQSLAVLNEWGAAVKRGIYWRLAVDVENEFEPKLG